MKPNETPYGWWPVNPLPDILTYMVLLPARAASAASVHVKVINDVATSTQIARSLASLLCTKIIVVNNSYGVVSQAGLYVLGQWGMSDREFHCRRFSSNRPKLLHALQRQGSVNLDRRRGNDYFYVCLCRHDR